MKVKTEQSIIQLSEIPFLKFLGARSKRIGPASWDVNVNVNGDGNVNFV